MQNNTMLTDGSNENDLKAISMLSMLEFLGETITPEKTFESVYNTTIQKIDGIILKREQDKKEELEKESTHKRIFEINDIVNSILETISNLPIDAQIKIKVALSHIGEQKENVKETSSIEESEESSNKQGAKSSGGRGVKTKRLG